MALMSDRCICLRVVEFSETSQILQLFARENGVQRVIAKGAHRTTKAGDSKFEGGIDLLDMGDAIFTMRPDQEMGTLTEWHLLNWNQPLHCNLRGMYLGMYAAEMVGLLIEEHDPHPGLFDLLENMLRELGTLRQEEVFLAFELDLLREVGVLPELSVCTVCAHSVEGDGRGGAVYFSPRQGGVVCQNCEATTPDRMGLDRRLLSIAQGILRLPRNGGIPQRLPRLMRQQSDPLNKILAAHAMHTLGRELRVAKWVNNPAATLGGKAQPRVLHPAADEAH